MRQPSEWHTYLIVSNTSPVEVLKEEEAFSMGSLVADVGGVLGLFIGFNFLMLWDWIKWCYVKIRYSLDVSSPLKNT